MEKFLERATVTQLTHTIIWFYKTIAHNTIIRTNKVKLDFPKHLRKLC